MMFGLEGAMIGMVASLAKLGRSVHVPAGVGEPGIVAVTVAGGLAGEGVWCPPAKFWKSRTNKATTTATAAIPAMPLAPRANIGVSPWIYLDVYLAGCNVGVCLLVVGGTLECCSPRR